MIESLRVGAYEGIMLNRKGYVAEGTISNLFLVRKGVLRTPSLETGILEGITRDLVLSLAKRLRVRTDEALLRPRDLLRADECFITNTTLEIMPVTSVNGKPARATSRASRPCGATGAGSETGVCTAVTDDDDFCSLQADSHRTADNNMAM